MRAIIFHLIVISVTTLNISAANADEKHPIPEKFRITVELDKPKFFLGELVLLHYCVENTGDKPFSVDSGGDYRFTYRHLRYRVLAKDSNGVEQPDPHPSASSRCMGGLGSSAELKPGEKWWGSIALHDYAQIDKPGIYTCSAFHDLGWDTEEDKNGKKRTAEIKIEFVQPTEAEAKALVDVLFRMEKFDGSCSGERTAPYRNTATLQFPIYLPLLKARAENEEPETGEALKGLLGIPSPEASLALIDLMANRNPERQAGILKQFNDRLPNPIWGEQTTPSRKVRKIFSHAEEYIPFSKAAWRAEMAPAIRAIANSILAKDDLENVSIAAHALMCVGTQDDAAPLMRVLSVALKSSEGEEFQDVPNPLPLRTHRNVLNALEELVTRGLAISHEPQTPAEFTLFMRSLEWKREAKQNVMSPELDAKLFKLLRHPSPILRDQALGLMQRPFSDEVRALLPELIRDRNINVQSTAMFMSAAQKIPGAKDLLLQVVATDEQEDRRQNAFRAAENIGARYEALRAVAKILDTRQDYSVYKLLLEGAMDSGGGSGHEIAEADRADLRRRWEAFLDANKERLQAGKRFKPAEEGLDPKLFPFWKFSMRDGKTWPLYCDEMKYPGGSICLL